MAPVLKTYLGCFKLRTGCLFTGYMGAIGSFLCIILSMGILIYMNSGFMDSNVDRRILMTRIFSVLLVICLLFFSLYVTLLVGVHQKRPVLLHVYLMGMTAYLAIMFILSIVVTFFNVYIGFRCLISFISSVYHLLVVRSYYSNLKELTSPPYDTKPV